MKKLKAMLNNALCFLEIGLVNYVSEHDKLIAEAVSLARKIALKPMSALKMAKLLIRSGQETSLASHLNQAASFQALCHFSDEHHKALADVMRK